MDSDGSERLIMVLNQFLKVIVRLENDVFSTGWSGGLYGQLKMLDKKY